MKEIRFYQEFRDARKRVPTGNVSARMLPYAGAGCTCDGRHPDYNCPAYLAEQANARLIAAAPDLLEACQGLTEIGRTQDGGIIVGPQGWDNLRAAIAKARGNDTP